MNQTTYMVRLNWFGEIHEFFTTTTSKKQACSNGIYKLAQLLKRDLVFVRAHFVGTYQQDFNNKIEAKEVKRNGKG